MPWPFDLLQSSGIRPKNFLFIIQITKYVQGDQAQYQTPTQQTKGFHAFKTPDQLSCSLKLKTKKISGTLPHNCEWDGFSYLQYEGSWRSFHQQISFTSNSFQIYFLICALESQSSHMVRLWFSLAEQPNCKISSWVNFSGCGSGAQVGIFNSSENSFKGIGSEHEICCIITK